MPRVSPARTPPQHRARTLKLRLLLVFLHPYSYAYVLMSILSVTLYVMNLHLWMRYMLNGGFV